jgi:hypothetical protein
MTYCHIESKSCGDSEKYECVQTCCFSTEVDEKDITPSVPRDRYLYLQNRKKADWYLKQLLFWITMQQPNDAYNDHLSKLKSDQMFFFPVSEESLE